MKKQLFLSALAGLALTIGCSSDGGDGSTTEPETFDPLPVQKTNDTKVYVHYMPWFETAESNGGQWGYHWTMANKNPEVITNGKRQIASHYYPAIGPYHSGDKAVIEYHLLLMKYAGIDGVLIDWYGSYDLHDYASNRENTEQLIAMLDDVGLQYAIVYEDAILPNIVNAGLAPSAANAAKTDMGYMKSHYFNNTTYIKIDGKPLLLNFGPQVLGTAADWTTAFTNLDPKPAFLTLWNQSAQAGTNASGEFSWVYQNNNNLATFYMNNVPNLAIAFGSAYPGFDDYYEEGGVGNTIGWSIPHNSGATLDATLSLAGNAGIDALQLVTWNDFGEGTMIEPTDEFGFSYLEKVKTFAGVQNTGSVFSEIRRLYDLRKSHTDAESRKILDKAFGYFVSLQSQKASDAMDGLN